MRQWIFAWMIAAVMLAALPPAVHAGTTGRRNTAIAATAVAAGAWANGTGKKGRRVTAIAATAGAAYAWKRYADKKKSERQAQPVRVTRRVCTGHKECRLHTHHRARPRRESVAVSRPLQRPACPCGHGCGIKEYEQKPDETKIKYLCGAEWERKASGETKFKL